MANIQYPRALLAASPRSSGKIYRSTCLALALPHRRPEALEEDFLRGQWRARQPAGRQPNHLSRGRARARAKAWG